MDLVVILMLLTCSFLVVAAVVKFRALRKASPEKTTGEWNADVSIEYEWTTRPGIWFRLINAAIVTGGIAWVVFQIPQEVRGENPVVNLFQYGTLILIFIGIASFLALKKQHYRITSDGLFRLHKQKGRGEERKTLLFSWENLAWLEMFGCGFRIHLKDPGDQAEEDNLVYLGDNANHINSMLKARGVPTSRQ